MQTYIRGAFTRAKKLQIVEDCLDGVVDNAPKSTF